MKDLSVSNLELEQEGFYFLASTFSEFMLDSSEFFNITSALGNGGAIHIADTISGTFTLQDLSFTNISTKSGNGGAIFINSLDMQQDLVFNFIINN